ncbi:MAG: S1C family serine protease [Patescibacteria group bacterium]
MHPPHLPPKSSSLEVHRLWQRLKLLLLVVVFGLIAGMSGASMMLGWIWPRFAEGDSWITSYASPGLSRAQLENRIQEEVAARIVSVYRGSTNLNGTNYLNKKIGDGIILSSDGWLAMYQPNYDGNYKNLYVTTQDGKVLQPEKAQLDKYSGIIYVKIKDQQFKVVSFNDENYSLDDIFVWQNSFWYHGSALYPFLNYKIPHLDSAPALSYSLSGSFNTGQVAINNQGRVVGFITEKNLLLPSFYITRILPKVLSQQTLSYPSLGVDGWFSEEQVIVFAKQKVQGFMVTSVWSSANPLRRGDVLTEINGRVVTADNLWYIISNSQVFNVKVLRGGKTLELAVKVTQTK